MPTEENRNRFGHAMHYSDGKLARLGDLVKLGNAEGIIVFSIDTDEYSPDHPRECWSYLERGVMIEFPKYGLIHYITPGEDLEFVSRASES
jgi:hypothetical protein